MPLAVLGGSFDPVHCGHVAMARHALDSGLAQDVLIIPASLSPFKSTTATGARHRLAMVQLAFSPIKNCEIDDREIVRGGSSFMVDTLEELHNQHPDRSLRLIIGQDNMADFTRWHRFADILDLARVLVLGRQGHAFELPEELSPCFISVPGFDQRVSSTEIRAILAAGQAAEKLLPAGVEQYILDHGLYR